MLAIPALNVMMQIPAEDSAESFARALDGHRGFLRLVAAAVVGTSDADDVVQIASLSILRRRGDFEAGTDFRAWAAAHVRNAARNYRRSSKRRRAHESVAREQRPYATPADRRDPAEREMHDHHARPLPGTLSPELAQALHGLSEIRREAILLKAVAGLSYAAIAAVLQVEESTARSHVYRAREQLVVQLQEPAPGTDTPTEDPSSRGAKL